MNKAVSLLDRWKEKLNKPIDASSLGLFRFFFGVFAFCQAYFIFDGAYIYHWIISAKYHFTYPLFDFLHLPIFNSFGINIVFTLMRLSAICIALGIYFRLSTIVYFLTFGYIFLLEKSLYNNHYYLILLITFLLSLSYADRWLSLDRLANKRQKGQLSIVPYWQVLLVKVQIGIVYLYGAFAKINADWLLNAQPMKIDMQNTIFVQWFGLNETAYLFSWGGFIVDLLLGVMLIFGFGRLFAFILIIFFNFTNHYIFNTDIGVFPFMMIGLFVIYLNPDTPRKVFGKVAQRFKFLKLDENISQKDDLVSAKPLNNVLMAFIIVYLAVQSLIPFRHFLIPGNVNWTKEGSRFSWRMRMNNYDVWTNIFVEDSATGERSEYIWEQDLTLMQIRLASVHPDIMFQYVQFLKQDLEQSGMKNPLIFVSSRARLNGRPFFNRIDGSVNLAAKKYSLIKPADWILSLEEVNMSLIDNPSFEEEIKL